MKIAILGWGSLIWDKRNLDIEKNDKGEEWFLNGPVLPIEFSRISNDGRLTLVIDSANGTEVKTLYCFSKYKSIDEAVLNLAIREGCPRERIGYYVSGKQSKVYPEDFKSKVSISDWCEGEKIEAIIWTNLKSNFKDKIGTNFSIKDAIFYLKFSFFETQVKAEEYIRRTPVQIRTPLRDSAEKEFNWLPIS